MIICEDGPCGYKGTSQECCSECTYKCSQRCNAKIEDCDARKEIEDNGKSDEKSNRI